MNAFNLDGYLLVVHSSSSSCCSPTTDHQTPVPLLPVLFLIFSILSVFALSISLYKKLKKTVEAVENLKAQHPKLSISSTLTKFHQTYPNKKPHSLLLDSSTLLASISSHFSVGDNGKVGEGCVSDGSEKDGGFGEDCGKDGKKRKKRGKKKRLNSQGEDGGGAEETAAAENEDLGLRHKHCLDCLYPFTSSSSATQRKIKQQYDQLVKCNAAKGLTMAQVGEFVNCLVEARSDLQHKSEIIQRKFTITKALLLKADRSSFDRISQQLYKLETEQKRLEEDANVYNRLQQQLKLSPAYKRMLEISASMELKANSEQPAEDTETDIPDISFEELLAQEKKDKFWQRNGKMRSCMS